MINLAKASRIAVIGYGAIADGVIRCLDDRGESDATWRIFPAKIEGITSADQSYADVD
jgi:homoserine dehydrogenase